MILRAEHFIICEKVIHDASNGCISAINIIDSFHTASFPCGFAQVAFTAIVKTGRDELTDDIESSVPRIGGPDKMSLKLTLTDTNGKTTIISEFYDREIPAHKLQYFGQIPGGIAVQGPGAIYFTLDGRLNDNPWVCLGRRKLDINFLTLRKSESPEEA